MNLLQRLFYFENNCEIIWKSQEKTVSLNYTKIIKSKKQMKMKVFKITYDSIIILVFAKDAKDVIEYLMDSSDKYTFIDEELYFQWVDFNEKVNIKEIPQERGKFHSESH